MRRARSCILVLLAVAVAALGATGCGGSKVEADEVDLPAPVLTIPQDSSADTARADRGDSESATETPTPTPTADAGAAAGTAQGGATGGTTGGTTQEPATGGAGAGQTTTQQADPGTTGGAGADQDFDTFCAENPGACPQQ